MVRTAEMITCVISVFIKKYLQSLSLTKKRNVVYLEFAGVNASCRVCLNGKKITSHDGGYSTFRVEITEQLQEENELTVYVDNKVGDRVYPQRADFTFYGGIYRDVTL